MKSLKIRLSIILALAVAFLAALGAFFGTGMFASADRDTTVDGSSTTLFNASAGAELRAHEQSGNGDEKEYYTMFAIKEKDGVISYKKHLAYTWYQNVAKTTETEGEGEGAVEKEVEDIKNPVRGDKGYFKMEVGFETLDFERFVIKFESQQYYKTKDEKTSNYVIFVPATEDGKVNVIITDNKNEKNLTSDTVLDKNRIKIEFTEKTADGYAVKVSDETAAVTGAFVNVGGTHAKYTTTSSLTVVPLSFEAELKTPAEGESAKPALMTLYELNGQSFKLKSASKEDDNDYYTGTTVVDNTPPVLCIDGNVSFIKSGEQIKFNYTVIDVLQSSPSSTLSYYILTEKQAKGEVENFNPEDMSDNKLFTEVTSGTVQRVIPRVEHYVPQTADYNTPKFDENVKVTAAVKAFIKLTDYSYTGGQSTYVLVDWYAEPDLLLTIDGKKYLAVANDEIGATFNYNESDSSGSETVIKSNPNSAQWKAVVEAYQKEVNKAAKGLKAGSKNYFYLPAFDHIEVAENTYSSLLSDKITAYEDLSFSIYYNNGSQQSPVTGKKYNDLSIPITKEGDYGFTIYAQDAASGKMYYLDEQGEKQEFASSEIWDLRGDTDKNDSGISKSDYLPWFTFHVGAAQLSIEEPKELDIEYVDNSKSVSFEINGVSGSYTSTYTLYLFDSAEYYNYAEEALTYEKFMELKQQLFENTAFKDANGNAVNSRRWFETIQITSGNNSVDVNSADYKKYEEYKWDGSGSFTPKTPNTFYLVTCEVKGTDGQADKAYMGIAAAPKVRDLAGEDTWVQDNMTSVILLCIAGASLIGIVLLLVIKPKDKGDVDEGFETERVKKPRKTKK